MSYEEFRSSLTNADIRQRLGLQLSDIEAQQVLADPASSQSWYSYWLSTQPTPPPPPVAGATAFDSPPPPPAAVATADAQPTTPLPDAYAPYPGQDALAAYPGAAPRYQDAPPEYPGSPSAYPGAMTDAGGQPPKKRNVGLWVTLSILGALLLIAAIVVVFAFTTARHWTKVDVPEQPETFHTETYETGRFDVTMDDVNPCWVNQDWTDCTNLMVATYNAACVNVELTETATAVCADYSGAIDEMKAQDGDGYYVATLGTYGSLHRTAETSTREVSNNDHKPAVTHEAVCYLGFLGECE